jgi:P27 family predicted phage terminase small subunit
LPTSETAKRLTGTFRRDRAKRTAAASTTQGTPTCPDWLSAEAKMEWRRVVPLIVEAGLLTRLDRALLASYCICWGRLVEAERKVAEQGPVIVTPAGFQQKSAWAGIVSENAKLVEKFGAQLGLSPASRARIPAAEREKNADMNPWAAVSQMTPLQRLRANRERDRREESAFAAFDRNGVRS